MILVKENLSLIQTAERNQAQVKYHVGARAALLGTSLILAAESVARAAAACLALIAYITVLFCWKNVAIFAERQMNLAKVGGSACIDCFLSVFSPKGLEGRLLKGPMGGMARELRMRKGAELIQEKLKKEFMRAHDQMIHEEDGPFEYEEGTLGSVERETVGGLDVGVCHYIGRRDEMEDEHLATSFNVKIGGSDYPVKLFGVFDGHGGPEASKYLKEKLQAKLSKLLVELNAKGLSDEGIWNALKMTFVQLNQEFKKKSGSTATVALLLDGKLWTANVGDSRTILDNNGQTIQLSEDAKPGDPRYAKGIKNRGGFVNWFGGMRVNGVLAVARSVGDHKLQGAVSARPKITAMSLKEVAPDSHLVLACDGIYDVASSRQIGDAVRDHSDLSPSELAQNIVFSAYQANSKDNLSAMVIRFT